MRCWRDREFQQKCLDVFQGYIKEKKTIVFVSHDLGSVRRFCKKALLLKHGEQVAFGETNEIIDRYVYGGGEKSSEKISNSAGEELKPAGEESKSKEKPESLPVEKIIQEKKKTRWGDKKVEIISVRFIDKFGRENTAFFSEDPITVKINYNVNAPIDDLVIGIALYSDNDVMCFGTNTDIKEFNVDKEQGSKEIRLKIHNLIMMEGKFHLTIAAHSMKQIPYDWLDKQFHFDVIKKGNNAGLFEIPCEWEQ
ncbi:MAG TPA: Wzt carbohydrate-binding domain-containing protein [Candidatus Limnocylindrales bacterium]|nr:Wzt carbohydrate-binding domain-containing protein [Candidatus Limnocylindrales bacterium]